MNRFVFPSCVNRIVPVGGFLLLLVSAYIVAVALNQRQWHRC